MVMVQKSATIVAPVRKQFGFNVPEVLYNRIAAEAKERGVTPTRYAQTLFEAAYAARHGNTGGAQLEDIVGATLLLWGSRYDTATIARVLHITEPQVLLIIKHWKARPRREAEAA